MVKMQWLIFLLILIIPAGCKNSIDVSLAPSALSDTTPPSVTINRAVLETVGTCRFAPVNDPTHASAFSYRVTFSKAINPTTFTDADITNTGTGGATSLVWTISNCGDNRNFKLTASSVIGDGTIIPSIDMDLVQDNAANLNLASTSINNSVDYSAPTGWVQEAYIKAVNSGSGDEFGRSVSISGDTLVVGARFEDSDQTTITNGISASTNDLSSNSGAVYVYKRTGFSWTQEAYLKAANNGVDDEFGRRVSISGDTLAVGATLEDSNETTVTNGATASADDSNANSGAVYIYKRTGSSWAQEAYIKASNSGFDDQFGFNFSLNGDTLAVGVYLEDSNQTTITNGVGASADNSSNASGAVYVYKRSGLAWIQEAYLKAVNNGAGDRFGWNVSLSGDSLAVGAVYEGSNQTTITNGAGASVDNSNSNSGAAYVYKRTASLWAQEAYIKAANNSAVDRFGWSISLSGDTLAVGAIFEDSNQTTITNGTAASLDDSNLNSGAVYVYKRTGAAWVQDAYIKASNNGAGDEFGSNIAISGDTLAVGAIFEDSNQTTITNGAGASSDDSIANSGAVYVFKRTGAVWVQEGYLKAANTGAEDWFGTSVSLSGDTLVVGAHQEDSNQSTITNGALASADDTSSNSGAVYVYRNDARLFDPSDVFVATATTSSITLKWSSAGRLALGYKIAYVQGLTPPVDCNSGTVVDVGDALTHSFTGLLNTSHYSFRLCSYDSLDNLSEGVGLSFNTASVVPEVANLASSDISAHKLTLSWVSGGGATSGFKIAYDQGVNPPTDCSSGTVVDVGNVLSYEITGLTPLSAYSFRVCSYDAGNALSFGSSISSATQDLGWNQEAYIKAANGDANDSFGSRLSLSGDTLVSISTTEDSNQTTITNGPTASADNTSSTSGAAYVYKRNGATWEQQAYIKSANSGASDEFGRGVFLSGDTLVVGTGNEDSSQTTITNGTGASTDNSSSASGAVYVYKRSGATWAQEAYIKATNNNSNDYFGDRVSISGDTLAVGATGEGSNQTTITNGTGASANNSSINSGAVYVYKRNGTTWTQEAYIKAANNGASDFFGSSVFVYGDTLAVSALQEDSNQSTITNGAGASIDNSSSNSGAVFIYKRTGVNWAQEAYIKAANNDAGDRFGLIVSISGDTLVVGADQEASNQTTITNGSGASSDDSNAASGAVYVYKRTAGLWAQEAYIKAANNDANDLFGSIVSISGDTLVVGASQEDSNQTTITNGSGGSSDNSNSASGAVYVYKRTGSLWAQEAYIKAANSDAGDRFGTSVSISGDTLVVGASQEDSNQTTITNGAGASSDNSNSNSGAVYVYRNNARLFEVHEVWTTATSNSISLTWHKSGGTATGYQYAYQVGATAPADCLSGTVVDAGDVAADTVTGLASGTTYSFRLCAYEDASTFTEGIVFSQTTP